MSYKILVVDDEKRIQDLVVFRLEMEDDLAVITADNGREALSQVASGKPDLMVLDVMMPDMTGIEICRKIKSDDATKNIKVILLTAKGRAKDQEEGMDAGANAYLTKPFRAKDIIETINTLLKHE